MCALFEYKNYFFCYASHCHLKLLHNFLVRYMNQMAKYV